MNSSFSKFLRPLAILSASIFVASCGSMDSVKTSTSNGIGKVRGSFNKVGTDIGSGFNKVADLTMSPFKSDIPIVEARPDALKKLPSGEDKALAYQRNNRFWNFLGPIDFKEPSLPDEPGSMDGGLLPPIE